MLIKETDTYRIEGTYNNHHTAHSEYQYTLTVYTGVNAELNGGKYNAEIQSIHLFPQHAIHTSNNDANDWSESIEFNPDTLGWHEGTDQSIREVYDKYIDFGELE